MPKVVCVLPHASTRINGVAFERLNALAVVSEEVSDAIAARFLSLPGYELHVEPATAPDATAEPASADAKTAKAPKAAKAK
jgi:hypothetical protein